jgi:hypothetical protein
MIFAEDVGEETRVLEGCVRFGAAFGLVFGKEVFDVG